MPAKKKPNAKPVQPVKKTAGWYPVESIADRLKLARSMSEYAGDQKILPAILGISYASLTSYERGMATPRRFPREFLERIAQIYGCDLQWLVTGQPSEDAIPMSDEGRESWERALTPPWAVTDGLTLCNMIPPAQQAA